MVDIVMRAKNGNDMTEAAIASIQRETKPEAYNLILVDDGSDLPQNAPCHYRIRLAESRGAVTATNMGLAISLQLPGDYVMVMDNDTAIPEGDYTWLRRFVREIEASGPECAAVGATSDNVNPPQQILYCPQAYTANWTNGEEQGFKENPDVPWFVSFCVLLRKSAIRKVGFWDERYNPGNFEDTDYSVKLRDAGYGI